MRKNFLIGILLGSLLIGCKKEEHNTIISNSEESSIILSSYDNFSYIYNSKGDLSSTKLIEGGMPYVITWLYLNDSLEVSSIQEKWSYPINSIKYNALGSYDASGVLTHINEGGWEIFNTVIEGDIIQSKEVESNQLKSYKKILYTNVLNKEKLPLIDYGGIAIAMNPLLYGNTVKHLPEKVNYMDSLYTNTIYTISYSYERNSAGLVSKITKIWSGKYSDTTVIPVEYKK